MPATIVACGKRPRSAAKSGVAASTSPTSLLRSTKSERGSLGGGIAGQRHAWAHTAASAIAPPAA
jgi:hypothetical protein